jgi:hypothetical protein
MPNETLLQSLLLKWEERRDSGQLIAPEELCSDCPDLLPELRRRIAVLQSADALLDTSDGQVERSPSSTANRFMHDRTVRLAVSGDGLSAGPSLQFGLAGLVAAQLALWMDRGQNVQQRV